MTERLIEMRRLLKPTGSIYLHCDPTASHYIKVVMDGIFGKENFRNEIVWERSPMKGGKAISEQFGRNIDVILFYSRTKSHYFKRTYKEHDLKAKHNKFKFVDSGGRIYSRDCPLGNYSSESIRKFEQEGRVYTTKSGKKQLIRYLDEVKGIALGSIWNDIKLINQVGKERLGYPTQKPLALLDRIIKASCPEDGIVLDPFCGCGTTVISAQKNKRKWIGMDICMLAVNSMEARLKGEFPTLERGKDYRIDGLPTTVEKAITLATSSNATKNEGRYQF